MTEKMMKISLEDLKDVAETLLYPLISRYVETRKENGIINDPKSVEIIEALDYDVEATKLFPISQRGACLRTIIFDEAVCAFLEKHPDGVIINLGCGLDTRFPRVDNGQLTWFDLDLPEVIALRRKFFEETDRHRFIASSALDSSWADEIPKDRHLLILMEGLAFYLTEEQNRKIISIIRENFKEAEFYMEAFDPFFITMCSYFRSKDPLDKKAASLLRWGIKSGKEMEQWKPGICYIGEQAVVDKGRQHFPLVNRIMFTLIPVMRRMTKIIHLRFVDQGKA
jgi:O-methyltransferase involved in polyketide biosynthesis